VLNNLPQKENRKRGYRTIQGGKTTPYGSNEIAHVFPQPTGYIVLGDSRVGNSGGLVTTGNTYKWAQTLALNALGFVSEAIGNILPRSMNSNYGLGASTSYNMWTRLWSISNAATGNAASTVTGNTSDQGFNTASSTVYSPVGHPANIVLMLVSVNDNAYSSYYTSPLVSMRHIANSLDALRHKTVFLSNEIPRGTGIAICESRTVASLTCTAINTSGFQDGTLTTLIDGTTNGGLVAV